MRYQRDSFIDVIYSELALAKNKDIIFMSADFGAIALDKLRKDYPKNFYHCGISEQAMIDIATGLALEKRRVFVYAMAPFLSLRALEQIKCGPGIMNLPITLLSVGIGLGYADSGPTHYATEDYSCLRSIVGSSIYTASDPICATHIAKLLVSSPKFSYVRLDRDLQEDINPLAEYKDIVSGYRVFGKIEKNKIAIITQGNLVHTCKKVFDKNNEKCFLIDLICSKPFPSTIIDQLKNVSKILVVDEQSVSGALPSCIFESFSSKNIFPNIHSLSLPEKYVFENGGRKNLLKSFGLDEFGIEKKLNQIL
jgi:transketolase